MNIAYILRLLLIAAAFAHPLLAPETSSEAFVIDFSALIFTGFVFLGCAFVSCFTGCIRIILSRRRDFLRPSLRAPMFSECSPVQFFWYVGILILSAGFGASVSNFTHTLSTDSVLMIAGGLGFLIGSLLTVKMNARRFISQNGKTDKA